MSITIALAGNPNSGKTTLFNRLTGSNQYVGNWPGVTVEKKTGKYKKDKDINITDLPGIYSLSPYTLEEVVSRKYLLEEHPDVIVDVVDASNIERNLYLSTQLAELGIPLVIALNMMDVVRKNNDKIDTAEIEKRLNCKCVEISAIKGEQVEHLMQVAKEEAASGRKALAMKEPFSTETENVLREIEENVKSLQDNPAKRWLAIKLFEQDDKVADYLSITPSEQALIDSLVKKQEEAMEDSGEGIITLERYDFVAKVTNDTVKKGRSGLTKSDKIDQIVTNRFLALPIFVLIMYAVYYIAVELGAGPINDWWADDVMGLLPEYAAEALEGMGVAPWLISLVSDGIIGGVGAVVGFLPVIAILFFLISILEDVGYMARIAFILDRVFRRFGLSGKSFIPILVGLGCSVSGIVGTRTIENENDRRMTIICASFMPCGAKMDYIAMFAVLFAGSAWYGPFWYLLGILAVIVTGVMLKKTSLFSGDPAPFVMELPEYHMPSMRNVLMATWDRCRAFLVKAGTIILLCTVVIWFLQNISVNFEFHEFDSDVTDSILAWVGQKFAWIFAPLGFGNWIASIAAVLGLVAKEVVVDVFGVLAGEDGLIDLVKQTFTTPSQILSFMIFNQLTVPCFAALGAIREEMGSKKWFAVAVAYQLIFSYTVSLIAYQLGRVFIDGEAMTSGTYVGFAMLLVYLYFIFRPNKNKELNALD